MSNESDRAFGTDTTEYLTAREVLDGLAERGVDLDALLVRPDGTHYIDLPDGGHVALGTEPTRPATPGAPTAGNSPPSSTRSPTCGDPPGRDRHPPDPDTRTPPDPDTRRPARVTDVSGTSGAQTSHHSQGGSVTSATGTRRPSAGPPTTITSPAPSTTHPRAALTGAVRGTRPPPPRRRPRPAHRARRRRVRQLPASLRGARQRARPVPARRDAR